MDQLGIGSSVDHFQPSSLLQSPRLAAESLSTEEFYIYP
jgi:hypothetical protein